jgi:hypothetical protein
MRPNDAQATVYEIEPAPYGPTASYQGDAATAEKQPGISVMEVSLVLLSDPHTLTDST